MERAEDISDLRPFSRKAVERMLGRLNGGRKKTRLMRRAKPTERAVKPHILTYIDIMGFKEIMRQRRAGEVYGILEAMRSESMPHTFERAFQKIKSVTFSDLTARAVPAPESQSLVNLLTTLNSEILNSLITQAHLVLSSVMLRGAMTIGDLHFANNTIFGDALVQAYSIEESHCIYPRIVIDTVIENRINALRRMGSNGDPRRVDEELEVFHSLTRRGDDGMRYIDYAHIFAHMLGDPAEALHFLATQRQMITENWPRSHEITALGVKLRWLTVYHNETVKRLAEEFESDDFYDCLASPVTPPI